MPRLNLKDDSLEGDGGFQESGSGSGTPPLRDVGSGGGGGLSPIVLILLIIAVLGLGVFALNHFGVIHLWGKKAVQVAEAFPEPTIPEPTATEGGDAGAALPPPAGTTEQAPAIAPPAGTSTAPEATAPAPMGTGDFTIQVSSWTSRAKAEAEAARLGAAGHASFVEEGAVAGTTWFRVRVGRYGSEKEAKAAIAAMQPGIETDLWVARVGR